MNPNTTTFITDDFLLQSKEAQQLYNEYSKELPIIDYHTHLSAKEIVEDKPLENIAEAWLREDHYKWRAMRANGVDEYYITGGAPAKEMFSKWAETVPYTLRNPLYHWTHLELKRYFNIDLLLQPETANAIYNKTNAILKTTTPTHLLETMNVALVCTTDDPIDSLEYHQKIAAGNFKTKVLPTFRSDNLFLIESDLFLEYLEKLESCVEFSINSFTDFLNAIDKRIVFFNENGCSLSDFGVGGAHTFANYTLKEVATIFNKRKENKTITPEEVSKFRSCLFIYLGEKYHEYSWTQQYHLGAIRNNNAKLERQFGANAGCDSIGDYSMAEFMSSLFNKLDESNKLAKTIAYNLDPSQNEVFASMMGNFNDSTIPGKMQWGSAWWFLDQKDGIEKQLNTLSNIGLLSRFIGMLTDSRSLLSFPRHEYFRRVLCNLIGQDIKNGLLPNDIPLLGKMVQNISYYNAKQYFNF